MVKPEALRGFLERAGTLPRGTDFIARFLIAWPGSTQSTRAYRPAPARRSGHAALARCGDPASPLCFSKIGIWRGVVAFCLAKNGK
jgi:putative DNA primase/helicase